MNIKDIIRSTFFGEYLISELHCIECKILPRLINDETAIKKYYKKHTGKELNLKNPVSFSEKLNWYKLYDRQPLMVKCADKLGVREYIKECGYEDLLNELYGVYDSVDDIDINKLPDQFVLKTTHGSHMNIIVKNKNDINWKQAKLMMSSWLKQDIYWSGREWCYKDIPKKIIAEKYIEDEDGELKDYKIHCFNGKPIHMEYHYGRYIGKHFSCFYDMNMKKENYMDDISTTASINLPVSKVEYNKMIEISRKLSKPFQYCRVDLYYVNNKIYFGEITFYDNGGYPTVEDNVEFSKEWKMVINNDISN